ncbi:MAG: dienelactone hydrolase family protein [Anaerolineae bacterium]|nr:dienelactone hydrolase family protein [Anaerolineae bacterium]MCI0608985.1 dienelactone hydrolase family protein [Anaerolineae bacterium]
MSIQKSEIKLDVNGKSVNAYLASPSNDGPGVLVLHAWWGLKPFFKQVCDRLAEQGFTAFAPDLRDGQIAETIEAAKELMEKSNDQLVGDIVIVAKDYLLAHSTSTKIGVMGFSMGAAWSLVVASNDPDKIAATVLFYGTYPGMDFTKVKSKVLGHYSDNDEWEPMDDVKAMEQSMKDAGVDATLHIYPGVAHWFVEEDRPEYDSSAASLAWERTFEFLRTSLRETSR